MAIISNISDDFYSGPFKPHYTIYNMEKDKFLRINFLKESRHVTLEAAWDRKFHFAFMNPNKCTIFEMDKLNIVTEFICNTFKYDNDLQLIELHDKEPDFMRSTSLIEYIEENL